MLAPAEFHIYLSPDEFEYLEQVVPEIVQDVQQCLTELVARLNKGSFLARVKGRRPRPIEVPASGWAIRIRPAVNQEVHPGELHIRSRLSIPVAPRSAAGLHRACFMTLISGGTRRTTITERITSAASDAVTIAARAGIGAIATPMTPMRLGGAFLRVHRHARGAHLCATKGHRDDRARRREPLGWT